MTHQTAAEKLRAQMLALIEQHERETIAARALAGDPNPTDADPLELVKWIADEHARDRAALLDRLADSLTMDDVRALRLAGEAAAAVAPRLICEAKTRGENSERVADRLGVTRSYVDRVWREHRKQQAD